MPQRLADILKGIDAGIGRSVKLCEYLALWDRVVDANIARNASAVKISNRILYVNTSSPAWANELSYLKKEIIEKFNKEAGHSVISEIKFKNGSA